MHNGLFGMVPQQILNQRAELSNYFYQTPDRYILSEHDDSYIDAWKSIGQLLDCLYRKLALTTGDTQAVNIVSRSFTFEKGDKVVIVNITYKECKRTLQYLNGTIGIKVVVLDFDLPVRTRRSWPIYALPLSPPKLRWAFSTRYRLFL